MLRPTLRSATLALAFLLALGAPLAQLSRAHAQEAAEEGRETRAERAERAGVVRAGAAPSFVWESGPAPELWAAPAIGLGVGGLTLALAVVLGQVATANHREATDPMTTQARAAELAGTVPDLSLAANILFAVGGGMAAIGAVWLIVLPFSQHRVPREAPRAAFAPSLRLSVGARGLSLEGSF